MAGSSVPTLFEQFSQNQTSSNMASNLHQHHQLLQNQLLDQQRPNTYQSPMQSNSYPSNFRQQRPVQISPGCHSTPALVAKHQEKFNVVQQMNDQMALMQKSLERQSGLLLPEQRGHPELLHMSTFHQAQNVTLVDQLKPGNPSQTMRLGNLQALSESTPQPELTNSIDWVDQAYHKILQMKEMFLSEILTLYKRTQEMRNSANSAETVSRCEKIRISIERIFTFLHMSRSDILCWTKEKLFQTMNDVAKYVSQAKASNALALMKQNQQVCSENVYSQFNNSTQPISHSIMKSNRKDFQTGFDQRALRMLLHPTSQHKNNNNNPAVISSNDIFNQSDCSATVSFKAQSSVTVSPPLQNMQQNHEAAMKRQKRKEGTKLRRFVRSNQISPCDISPQSSQQPNSQLQIKDLSSKFSKSATSSSASPSPLTPSSKAADCAKSPLCLEEETSRFPKDSDAPPLQDKSQNLIVTGTQLGIMNSGENTESKQLSRGEGDPVKCLVDVVKSMSSRGLNSAIQDINAVTNLSDRIAANFLHDESTKVVLQDLADDISNFTRRKSTTKDQLETTTSNEMKTDQMEFCASGEVGRLKKEVFLMANT
ncbi:hypothetical protein DH2020_041321 [Rehmannia glutinosa]|uniref:Uncharacterized protein n=1 Tax=Rehmannia glutinosa TaxID=99300 RepID=A0ABR0UQK0_REHGL